MTAMRLHTTTFEPGGSAASVPGRAPLRLVALAS
jgi:hypothetical protein